MDLCDGTVLLSKALKEVPCMTIEEIGLVPYAVILGQCVR